jgi:hypothetical protein
VRTKVWSAPPHGGGGQEGQNRRLPPACPEELTSWVHEKVWNCEIPSPARGKEIRESSTLCPQFPASYVLHI